MNGNRKSLKIKRAGRRWISCATSCRPQIRSIYQPIQSTNPTADRYCHAIERNKQRTFKRLMALFIRGPRLEIQGPNKTSAGSVTGARSNLLHSTRQTSKQNQLVRRNVDGIASPSRNGLWTASIAAISLSTLARKKCILMYASRTYEYPYKYVCRTWEVLSKYGRRSYLTHFCHFLSTPAVHHLELPSAIAKSTSSIYCFKRWVGQNWPHSIRNDSAYFCKNVHRNYSPVPKIGAAHG